MKLKINKKPLKTTILTENGSPLYEIKRSVLSRSDISITSAYGSEVYSIKKDPKPLDRRIKYIFTETETGNKFYAWIKKDYSSPSLYRYLLSSGLEISIEAESFFGELLIKRSRDGFELYVNDKPRGKITKNILECDLIDDPALLTVLYALTNYIISAERESRAPSFA